MEKHKKLLKLNYHDSDPTLNATKYNFQKARNYTISKLKESRT